MSEFNPRAVLKLMRRIYLIEVVMVLAYYVIAFLIVDYEWNFSFIAPVQIYALLFLFVAVIPASILIPKKYMEKELGTDPDFRKKMATCLTVMLISTALFIGVALFSVVIFLQSGNLFPLFLGLAALAINTMNYPTTARIRDTVKLKPDEYKMISD